MLRLTRYERETIINYNEGENVASISTHNRALQRYLKQRAMDRPSECHLEKVSHGGKAVDYIIPKSWIHIYPPRKISDKQRAAMAERMKTANLRKKTTAVQGVSDK